jgi:hypothetical protein
MGSTHGTINVSRFGISTRLRVGERVPADRQQDALDVRYIRLWLCEFAALLEQPERVEMFEKPWRELHSTQKGQ